MFPSLSQETIQALIQESQQKVGKERIKDFSNPFTAPFQGEVSQYDPKLYTENVLSNLEDYRARQQSVADALVNTVTKNLGKFALRAVDNIGFPVWAAIGVAQQGDASGLYNNPVSSLIRDMESGLDEALPNYMTKEQQDSVLSKFGSVAGLNSILDGLSYTGAAIVGGLGTSKLLQIGSKGLGRIAKNLALSDDLVEVVTNTLTTNKVDGIINLLKPGFITHEGKGLLKSFGASAYGATVEAAAEASETYKTISEDWYQKIMQEKGVVTDEDRKLIHEQAKQGANTNFGVNMAVISGSRFLQLNKLFRNQTDDFKRVAGVVRGETGEFAKEVGKLNKYKKFFDVGANTLEEAGEELSQSYSNSFLTSYYSADDSKYRNVMGAMADAYDSVIGKEGQESGLVGGAVGLISSLLTGGLKTRKRENDREQEAIAIANNIKLNPAMKTLAQSTARTFRLDDLQEKAAQEGDLFTYENLKNAKLFDVVKSRLDIDAYDDLVADIKGDSKLTQEEFETKYELKPGTVDKDAFVSELLQKSEKIKNGYEDVVKRFGTSVNPMTLQTIALTGSVIENAKEREAKVKTELMKEGFDYDAFIAKKSKSNSGLRYLLDQRIKQEQIVKDLQSQHRKAVKENNVDLASELSSKISDEWQKQLSLDTEINEGVNDLPEGKSFSFIGATKAEINKFKNTLAENEDRVGDAEIKEKDLFSLPITNRRKVEYLAKDLKKLQQMQAEFGYAYNDLVTKGDSSKTIQRLQKSIDESDGAKLLKDTFTVNGSERFNEKQEDGTFKIAYRKTQALLDKGKLYSYTPTRLKDNADKTKRVTGSKRYTLEVKDRRVTNGIPEVLVSEENGKPEWKKLGYLNRLGLTEISEQSLTAEEVFYNQYKDRLITSFIPSLFEFKNGVPVETHSAGVVTGFMSYNSDNKLTLSVWNETEGKWLQLKGSVYKSREGKLQAVGETIFNVDGKFFKNENGNAEVSGNRYLKVSTKEQADTMLIATSQVKLKKQLEAKIKGLQEGKEGGVKSPSLSLLIGRKAELEKQIADYANSFDSTKLSSFSVIEEVLKWNEELAKLKDDIAFREKMIELYTEELKMNSFEPQILSDFDAEFNSRKQAIIENEGYKNWFAHVQEWKELEKERYDDVKEFVRDIDNLVITLERTVNEIVHGTDTDAYESFDELAKRFEKNPESVGGDTTLYAALKLQDVSNGKLKLQEYLREYVNTAREYKNLKNLQLVRTKGFDSKNIDRNIAVEWDLMMNQKSAIDAMINWATGNAFERIISNEEVNLNENYQNDLYSDASSENDIVEILPTYDHNGNLPFRKTTGTGNKESDTSNTGRSKNIFEKWLNSAIPEKEVSSSLLRVVTTKNIEKVNDELKALGINPIEINYVATDINDTPFYTIVTDEFGEFRRFDANGSPSENGKFVAVSVLSSLEDTTSGGKNKFRDFKEQLPAKIAEDKKTDAEDREKWLQSKTPVYLPIRGRTFGVAKFDKDSISLEQAFGKDVYEKLLKQSNVDKKDAECWIEVATDKGLESIGITNGVKSGRTYYVDKSGRFIALNSRTLNEKEADSVYYGVMRALDTTDVDSQSVLQNIKNIIRWGFLTKPAIGIKGEEYQKRLERAYAIYKTANGRSIRYGYGETLEEITFEELEEEGEAGQKFKKFLLSLPVQISNLKINNFSGFSLKSYNKKGTENFKNYSKGYIQFLLDDVLTTRLRPNNPQLNDTQFENSYVRVGNQTEPKVKVAATVQEKSVTELSEDLLSEFGGAVDANIDDFDLDSAVSTGTGGLPKKSPTPVTNDLGGDPNFSFPVDKTGDKPNTPSSSNAPIDWSAFQDLEVTDENRKELYSQPKLGAREAVEAKKILDKYGFSEGEAELVSGFIGNKSFGRFWHSANKLQVGISVSNKAPVFTTYHEEFHLVEMLYLTFDKRKQIYTEWLNANGGKPLNAQTAKEASEGLAEEYRYYVIQKKHKVLGTVAKFIKGLHEFIQKVLKMKLTSDSNPVIKKMFNDIYSGAYANTKRGTVESRELINKSLTTVLFDTLSGKYKFGEEPPKTNILRFISDSDYRKQVESAWIKYYEKYGIKSFADVLKLHIKASGGKENPVVVNNDEIKEFYNYLNPDRVENEEDIEEDTKSVNSFDYGRQDVVDPRNSLSSKVKLLLKAIPEINEKGEFVSNRLGLSYHTDTDTLLNDLFSAMRDVSTEEEIISVLRDSKDFRFKELYKLLQYDKPVVLSELLVQNEFLQFFSKSYAEYDSYYISEDDFKIVQMNQVAKFTNIEKEINANFRKIGGSRKVLEDVITEYKAVNTKTAKGTVANNDATWMKLIKDLGFGVLQKGLTKEQAEQVLTSSDAESILRYISEDLPKFKSADAPVFKKSTKLKEVLEKVLEARGTGDSFVLTTAKGQNKYVVHKHSYLTKSVKKVQKRWPSFRLSISNSLALDGESGETENSDLEFDDALIVRLNQLVLKRLPFIFSGSKSLQYELSNLPNEILTGETTESYVKDYMRDIYHHYKELHSLAMNSKDSTRYVSAETRTWLKNGGGFKAFTWLSNDILTALSTGAKDGLNWQKVFNENIENIKKQIEAHLKERVSAIADELRNRGYLEEKQGEIASVKGLNIPSKSSFAIYKDLLENAVAFSELGNYWQTKNLTGSLFLYEDALKRFPAMQSGKDNFNVSSRMLTWINDKDNSPLKTNDFQSSANAIVLNDMKVGDSKFTDAQGIVSPEFFRLQSIAEGQSWSVEHEAQYNYLMQGGEPKRDDVIVFGARKPQFYGKQRELNEHEEQSTAFFKMSTYPLFPYLAKQFPDLRKLSNAMKASDVHIVAFHSAVKVGRKTDSSGDTLSFYDFITNPTHEAVLALRQPIFLENYGTQTAVSEEKNSTQLEASQIRKIIKGDLIEHSKNDLSFDGIKYSDLLSELDALTYEKIQLSDAKLLEELGIEEYVESDEKNFRFKNRKIVREKIVKEAKGKSYPQNIVNGINQLLSEGKGLDIVIGRDRIESLLLSLVRNNSIKLKRHGDAAVQTSPVGFVSFTKDSIEQSDELGWYQEKDGRITAMEVYLPDYLRGSIDPEKATPEEIEKLLTFIGFRIPTQALASIDKIVVKKFIPGNMIVVPKQHPGKTGGDFDVDKLNLYFPEVYFVKGKPVYIQYENFENTWNEYKETHEEATESDYRDLRIKAINNRVSEHYKTILSDPRNEYKLLEGIDDKEIRTIANKIRGLRGIDTNGDVLDFMYLIKKGISHQGGKAILGQIALHNTHHVESQLAGLKFNSEVSAEISSAFPLEYNEKLGVLDRVKDLTGEKNVSASIDQYVSAAVDVEKDDYIIDLNFTKELTGLGMLMIRLGIPLQDVNLLMTQPVMIEYTRLFNLYSSVSWKAQNGEMSATRIRAEIAANIEKQLSNSVSGRVGTDALMKEIEKNDMGSPIQHRVWNSLMKGDASLFAMGQVLNNFMQVTKYDTQGNAKSFAENELIKKKAVTFNTSDNRKNKEKDGNLLLLNTDRFFNRGGNPTALQGFKEIVEKANSYFASLFDLELPHYKRKLSPILEKVYSAFDSSSEIVRTVNIAKRDFLTYVIQNFDLLAEKSDLLFGAKSVPARISKLQEKKGFNKLVDELIVDEVKGTIFLGDSGRMDVIKTNSYNEAFEELWEVDPQLGEDFVKFILFQNGFKRSPLTLMDIVPNKILNDVVKKFYMDNTITVDDMNDFALKLAANNPKNSILVPYKSPFDSYREGFSKSKKGAGYVLNHTVGKKTTQYELDGRNGSDYVSPVFPVKEESVFENSQTPPKTESQPEELPCNGGTPKA